MKIAVTGANGYIGKHVIEALKKTNHTIIPVDINKTFNCINADILSGSPQIYQSLLAPDALIHLAWKDGFNHNAESHIENLYSHFLFLKNMIDSGCSNITVMGTMHECGFIDGKFFNQGKSLLRRFRRSSNRFKRCRESFKSRVGAKNGRKSIFEPLKTQVRAKQRCSLTDDFIERPGCRIQSLQIIIGRLNNLCNPPKSPVAIRAQAFELPPDFISAHRR